MAYTDLTKILLTIPEITVRQLSDDNNVGEIDTAVVDEMILDADSLIDSYTRGRYPANMAEIDVPPFIRTISTCFAIYNLYTRKLILTIPEALQKKFDNAIKTLENIQKGDVTPFPSGDEPETVIVVTRPRVFTQEKLDEYTC